MNRRASFSARAIVLLVTASALAPWFVMSDGNAITRAVGEWIDQVNQASSEQFNTLVSNQPALALAGTWLSGAVISAVIVTLLICWRRWSDTHLTTDGPKSSGFTRSSMSQQCEVVVRSGFRSRPSVIRHVFPRGLRSAVSTPAAGGAVARPGR
jgi:hypothetical protein